MGKLLAFRKSADRYRREFADISYAAATDPRWKQLVIRGLEHASGRRFLEKRYRLWRERIRVEPQFALTHMLELLNISLVQRGSLPSVSDLENKSLVMIANHPFGIADGAAIISLAEKMGRPCRILIHRELLKVPEIRPYALPVSFEETKEAMRLNLETRHEAQRLLKQGVTIIIFPSGGVATASRGFGKAEDLPWKRFAAKLVQSSGASVLPVFFEGQCSRSFHLASKISMTLRTALLIRELRRLAGKTITAHVGDLVNGEELASIRCRDALTSRLQHEVMQLAPGQDRQTKHVGTLGPREIEMSDESIAA